MKPRKKGLEFSIRNKWTKIRSMLVLTTSESINVSSSENNVLKGMQEQRITLIKPRHEIPTMWYVRQAKAQTSLRIRAV